MSRFYRREWENVAQRAARELGTRYTMIHAGGEPEAPAPAEEIRQAVSGWCEVLSRTLQPQGFGPVGWDENDTMPYFTDRPAWEGYAALLVWAAHAEHPDLPLPANVPRSWADDEAYQRSTVPEFQSGYRTVLEPEVWIPAEFPFVLEAPSLVSEKACIGSTYTLKQQLDDLQQHTARQLHELKQAPRITAPVTKKAGFLGGFFSRKAREPEPPAPNLAEVAEFALSVFRDLATKACEHRLPLLLHY